MSHIFYFEISNDFQSNDLRDTRHWLHANIGRQTSDCIGRKYDSSDGWWNQLIRELAAIDPSHTVKIMKIYRTIGDGWMLYQGIEETTYTFHVYFVIDDLVEATKFKLMFGGTTL